MSIWTWGLHKYRFDVCSLKTYGRRLHDELHDVVRLPGVAWIIQRVLISVRGTCSIKIRNWYTQRSARRMRALEIGRF